MNEIEPLNLVFDTAVSARTIDQNGYMHVSATPITKAVVNPYLGREIPGWETMGLKPDGIYYGYRDPAELKKAAPTFNGVPLLLNHHEASAEDMPKEAVIGSVGTDADFDGEYVRATLTVTDAEAIKLIESGKMKELSCSYFFRPDFTSGKINGVPYDFIMRDIKGNHVALVEEGRAGHDVKVIDSKKGNSMQKKTIKDADPKIEALEVKLANMAKAVNAVEAQVEGINPADIGLDIDPAATVEEIADTFFPGADEAERAKVIAVLTALKSGDGDTAPVDTPPAPAGDDDTHSEEWQAGFAEGVKYGEAKQKEEPGKLARLHEGEGEKRYLEKVGDTLAKVKQAAKDEAIKHFKELSAAATECRAYIGNADPMAFDSAADIYGTVLKANGYDLTGVPEVAYKAMFGVMQKEKRAGLPYRPVDNPAADELPKGISDLLGKF